VCDDNRLSGSLLLRLLNDRLRLYIVHLTLTVTQPRPVTLEHRAHRIADWYRFCLDLTRLRFADRDT
jgi:hypothetical protein